MICKVRGYNKGYLYKDASNTLPFLSQHFSNVEIKL